MRMVRIEVVADFVAHYEEIPDYIRTVDVEASRHARANTKIIVGVVAVVAMAQHTHVGDTDPKAPPLNICAKALASTGARPLQAPRACPVWWLFRNS